MTLPTLCQSGASPLGRNAVILLPLPRMTLPTLCQPGASPLGRDAVIPPSTVRAAVSRCLAVPVQSRASPLAVTNLVYSPSRIVGYSMPSCSR